MRSVPLSLLAFTTLALLGCPSPGPDPTDGGPGDGGPVVTCDVVFPTACPDPAPRYGDVSPVFQSRCYSCHSTSVPGGQWPLTSFEDIVDWQDTIRADVGNCSMPPPDGGTPMPTEERLLLLTWIRCGAPQ